MKRIFFLLYSMSVGGVEKALLGLLTKIPLDQYEVHVGLLIKKGGFMNLLPKEVKVHEIDCYSHYWQLIQDPPLVSICQMLKHGQIINAVVHLFLYFHYKLTANRISFFKYILRNVPMLSCEFDLAVAFSGPSQMIDYYICEKVTAKKKCVWIHFDISKNDIDKGMISQLYNNYNKIFIVSEEGKVIFDKMFPHLASKTEVFHNVVSKEQVLSMAEVGPTFDDCFDGKRILTVGRVSEEKGQLVTIEALKLLLDKGYQLKWYFVGDGPDRECCKKLVAQYGLNDKVVFLGTQLNPYGFMRDCDLYVQPSRHEGFCITLAEALCFNKPIVATNFTGANEQLQERENGIVVGMSAEDIAIGVIKGLKMGYIDVEKTKSYDDTSSLFDLLQ